MQALQVGNEIASQQIDQMQKLREVVMAQTNAQVQYMAYKTQKAAQQHKQMQEIGQNADDTYPTYNGNSQLGEVPDFGQSQP
jgi:P-type conjugative transfer protein TrbJ